MARYRNTVASLLLAILLNADPVLAQGLQQFSFIGYGTAIINPSLGCAFDMTKTCITETATANVSGNSGGGGIFIVGGVGGISVNDGGNANVIGNTVSGEKISNNGNINIPSSNMSNATQTVSFLIDMSEVKPNGKGGLCYPLTATGTTSITGGEIFDFEGVGNTCDSGSSQPFGRAPRIINATLFITGGSGQFANASGTGQLTGSDDGYGNQVISSNGVLHLEK